MKYFKQIDGLRAFACIAVIIHHWISDKYAYASYFHNGAYGVDLFFVISGFLITTILLNEKEKNKSIDSSIKRFYYRRVIRIFPVYYIYLLFIFFMDWQHQKAHSVALLSYLYNFDLFFTNWNGVTKYTAHLWSLSVEEQFYLIFPFIILAFSARKSLKVVVGSIIVCFIISSYFFFFSPYKELKLFTPYSFIGLLMGALLAFKRKHNFEIKNRGIIFFAILFLFIALKSTLVPHFPGKNILSYIFPIQCLFFFLLVDKAAEGFTGMGKQILENRLLVFIGRLSYGLYVYHLMIPGLIIPNDSFAHICLNIGLLLSITLLSWNFIEKPFNKLKNREMVKIKEVHTGNENSELAILLAPVENKV